MHLLEDLLEPVVRLLTEELLQLAQQLATALRKNSARVLDLFRSWDADGDGQVTKAEFSKGLTKLKMQVEPADIDALFADCEERVAA